MTMPLTLRQRQLVDFIGRYTKMSGGVSPTFAEMGEYMGCGKGNVSTMLDRLEERGAIRRLHHRSRAIEIVEQNGSLQVDSATLAMLDAYAVSTGQSHAEIVAAAVDEYVVNHAAQPGAKS